MQTALPPDEAHIWQCFSADWADDACAPLLAKLSAPERKRCAAFHFEKDRRLFAVSHALTRAALALYTGAAAEELVFQCDVYGKPSLVPQSPQGIHFNLTHTAGYVACAVARDEVGIDAENIERGCDLDVAKLVFAPSELRHLLALPSERASAFFFELWTLKEAFIKAKGQGMSMDLQSFWFEPGATPKSISFAAHLSERPGDWEFHAFEPASGLRMTLACGTGGARKRVQILDGTKLLKDSRCADGVPGV